MAINLVDEVKQNLTSIKREGEVELTVYLKCTVSLSDLDAFKDSVTSYASNVEAIAKFPGDHVELDL